MQIFDSCNKNFEKFTKEIFAKELLEATKKLR
jgi:hypothetical protein